MANDLTLPLRRGVIAHLKNDPALTALVPAARVYGPEPPPNPAFPFIRYGLPVTLPFAPSGCDGSAVSGIVHAFAKGPGEDDAAALGAAIAKSLGGAVIDLASQAGFPATAYLQWAGTDILQDAAEAGAWQAAVRFQATITATA
jgi:hypothetical protein